MEVKEGWKSTCRAVLGGEIGELDEYSQYLSGLNDPLIVRQSANGRPVVMTSEHYPPDAPVEDMEKIDFSAKFEPLDLNDIKDIDSLRAAVAERTQYCGDVVIGNSKFVESSSEISDSFYIYKSVRISGCKRVAYSQWMRLSEDIYGTNEGGETKACIRCGIVYRNQRSFELWIGGNTSDSYYSYGLENCQDCIFCFNLIGKSRCIGNVQLTTDKYTDLKKKLLAEIRQELVKNKTLPSLVEIVNQGKANHAPARAAVNGLAYAPRDNDKTGLESAFSGATAVVLGRRLKGIDAYAQWLMRDSIVPRDAKSVLSDTTLQVSDYPVMRELPLNRIVTQEEALVLGQKLQAPLALVETASLSSAVCILEGIAYFPPERRLGTYKNLVACQWGSQSTDCYRTVVAAYDKYCGYNAWPRSSENIYGSGLVFNSEYGFKCFDGLALKRCLEMDSCRECSDCYFCHNVENCQECMFCFNVKAKRYAIGNVEYPREQYLKIKKMVLAEIAEKLEKNKRLEYSIYNIGAKK
ncbi:Uncharacterised protein [uncultured archaeon]|nr:Uncharacterised protein [uncultured archaeon]